MKFTYRGNGSRRKKQKNLFLPRRAGFKRSLCEQSQSTVASPDLATKQQMISIHGGIPFFHNRLLAKV
jgi:hypothetical protein